ncbi:MAG: hypothetical protein KDA24_17275 [Deltaproteobacteria bacterium]|nr:hypothetical protein [Deltaproteobacteria bacterium]
MSRLALLFALTLPLSSGCGATWSEPFDAASHGALSGVWGSGPDDVFIVGGDFTQSEILHFDGSDWTDMEAPPLPLLAWVYGWGPDQVMAVGVDGGAAWYNGTSWEVLETGTDEDLWGVFGFGPDDVWAVGGDASDLGSEPVVLHWDGTAFESVTIDPAEMPRAPASLFKVWGVGDTLFALGQNGQIVSWDGTAWRDSPAGAGADQDFVSLWGTGEDNIVAVGGRGNSRIGTWDGSAWNTVQPSGVGGLNAVSMTTPDVALVGGVNGFVGTFDVASGELQFEETLEGGDVHAIWADEDGRHYAVGGRFSEPMSGLAFVRKGAL